MQRIQKISPCLWFDGQAEAAARLYSGIFPNSRIGQILRFGAEGQELHGQAPGSVMTVAFELDGQAFTGLNGGPQFRFTEAVSFQVHCESQDEIDHYWRKLGAGGPPEAQQCGWLKDQFGVSWQIVPAVLPTLLAGNDAARSGRVMHALLGMQKLDIGELKRAYAALD